MWELFGDADGEEGVGNVRVAAPRRESEGPRIFPRHESRGSADVAKSDVTSPECRPAASDGDERMRAALPFSREGGVSQRMVERCAGPRDTQYRPLANTSGTNIGNIRRR